MNPRRPRDTREKVGLFRRFFGGQPNHYLTTDLQTGRIARFQGPAPAEVILDHLAGRRLFSPCLSASGRTRALVFEFTGPEQLPPMALLVRAGSHGLTTAIERSRSGAFRSWIFLENPGVSAAKARMASTCLVAEIRAKGVSVFPNALGSKEDIPECFVEAPLFGPAAVVGQTLFVDPGTFKPHPDQWDFLCSLPKAGESLLDEIISLNRFEREAEGAYSPETHPWETRTAPPRAGSGQGGTPSGVMGFPDSSPEMQLVAFTESKYAVRSKCP